MDDRVPFVPEVWFVPPTLADLECRHGRIGRCDPCDRRRRELVAEAAEEMEDALVERVRETKEVVVARKGDTKWTREAVLDAIREVGARVGRTPSAADMRECGYGGAHQQTTFDRLGATWAELVAEAGFEPRTRGDNGGPRPRSNGNAPAKPFDQENDVVPEPKRPFDQVAEVEVEIVMHGSEAEEELLDAAIRLAEVRNELAAAELDFRQAIAKVVHDTKVVKVP